jgi:hypothetical protein
MRLSFLKDALVILMAVHEPHNNSRQSGQCRLFPAGHQGRRILIFQQLNLLQNSIETPKCVSRPPASPTAGYETVLGNAAANPLTCHVREADANLLNLLPQSSPHLPANHSIQVHSEPCFLLDTP